MIGIPKIRGSLILKIPGTIEALPIALNCSDLARVASQIHRPRVAPEPPAITHIRKLAGYNETGSV